MFIEYSIELLFLYEFYKFVDMIKKKLNVVIDFEFVFKI